MRLDDIGFYTLSNNRARNLSSSSPLWRCELLLTERCNFSCPYCRGLRKDCQGDMPLEKAKEIIALWAKEGLKNIRFSGGEPAVYKDLPELVSFAKENGVERIAISTNGSAPLSYYQKLVSLGVNDFSISLDACCSATCEKMCGGIKNVWERITTNIKELSKLTYVTVGVVLTEDNIESCKDIIIFAHGLGVSDIRIISSAQSNVPIKGLSELPKEILDAHPILRYRIKNLASGTSIRGLDDGDTRVCHLVKDDMAVAGNYHFPCIIYLREGGEPIGVVGPNMRQERIKWSENHDCQEDPICKKNCLDVCVEYNNKVRCYRQGVCM